MTPRWISIVAILASCSRNGHGRRQLAAVEQSEQATRLEPQHLDDSDGTSVIADSLEANQLELPHLADNDGTSVLANSIEANRLELQQLADNEGTSVTVGVLEERIALRLGVVKGQHCQIAAASSAAKKQQTGSGASSAVLQQSSEAAQALGGKGANRRSPAKIKAGLGCALGCRCGWSEQCGQYHVIASEGHLLDVGSCQHSMSALWTGAISFAFVALFVAFATRAILAHFDLYEKITKTTSETSSGTTAAQSAHASMKPAEDSGAGSSRQEGSRGSTPASSPIEDETFLPKLPEMYGGIPSSSTSAASSMFPPAPSYAGNEPRRASRSEGSHEQMMEKLSQQRTLLAERATSPLLQPAPSPVAVVEVKDDDAIPEDEVPLEMDDVDPGRLSSVTEEGESALSSVNSLAGFGRRQSTAEDQSGVSSVVFGHKKSTAEDKP